MDLSFTYDDCFDYLVADSIDVQRARQAAEQGTKLKVKLGIDPTSPNIHLGRAVPVWRLRAFQELGHEVHLVIGDFTGQVGDASDKEAERPMLSAEVVQGFMKEYERQLWMILNTEKKEQVFFHYNSEWLATLSFAETCQLADAFSVNQFIKRELVAKRLESGSRVSLREMLYPLMQGYDSVMIKADVELGGTDQWFNLLAGRTLQELKGQTPQAVITNPLMSGLDGRKMSSSWGNIISLLDSPADKFAKMMMVRDDLMVEYLNFFPLSARPFTPEDLQQQLGSSNPRDIKMKIAHQLVALYHGAEEATHAQEQWTKQFSEGQLPEEIREVSYAELAENGELSILQALVKSGLAPSNSEARRLIEQGGVRLNEQVIANGNDAIPGESCLLQVGKRNFVRINP